jgi:hypothetical protein
MPTRHGMVPSTEPPVHIHVTPDAPVDNQRVGTKRPMASVILLIIGNFPAEHHTTWEIKLLLTELERK